MGYGPLPSFLIQMPLGTPHEEVSGFQHKVAAFQQPVEGLKKFAARHNKRKGKNGFVHRWADGDVRLSMSKMSIMSLVLGLLFLGVLFFIIGFLAAVATVKFDEGRQGPHSAWQASNANLQEDQDQTGQGKKSGHGSGGGSLIGGAIKKQLGPLGKTMGAAIPAPLKPFARYGLKAGQKEVKSVTAQVNPFATRKRGGATSQEYNDVQQQPPASSQPYSYPPNQPSYGGPASFPQPGVNPQEGYYNHGYAQGAQGYTYTQGGYAPMPQQPMMVQQPPQQPYYQQPAQQMAPQPVQQPYYQQPPQQPVAPQPVMAPQPQMAPQQQMMAQQLPYPQQYPQQMPPQQGYYP